mmetsp:Transcript_44576/g.144782  ORF Transcript_44576/g.144782 Transcript_44576/m.144782 type:complete len:566 (+) Transcript_44576:228-1925(+)
MLPTVAVVSARPDARVAARPLLAASHPPASAALRSSVFATATGRRHVMWVCCGVQEAMCQGAVVAGEQEERHAHRERAVGAERHGGELEAVCVPAEREGLRREHAVRHVFDGDLQQRHRHQHHVEAVKGCGVLRDGEQPVGHVRRQRQREQRQLRHNAQHRPDGDENKESCGVHSRDHVPIVCGAAEVGELQQIEVLAEAAHGRTRLSRRARDVVDEGTAHVSPQDRRGQRDGKRDARREHKQCVPHRRRRHALDLPHQGRRQLTAAARPPRSDEGVGGRRRCGGLAVSLVEQVDEDAGGEREDHCGAKEAHRLLADDAQEGSRVECERAEHRREGVAEQLGDEVVGSEARIEVDEEEGEQRRRHHHVREGPLPEHGEQPQHVAARRGAQRRVPSGVQREQLEVRPAERRGEEEGRRRPARVLERAAWPAIGRRREAEVRVAEQARAGALLEGGPAAPLAAVGVRAVIGAGGPHVAARAQPPLPLGSPPFGPLAHKAAVLVGAAVALGVDDAVGAPESDERVQVREGEDRLRGDHPAALHQRALVLAADRQLRARVRAEPRALHV